MRSKVLAVVCILLVVITFNPVSVMRVHGSSMEPTIRDGDLVFTMNRGRKVEVGDIVTFRKNEELLLKRVVGVEGDVLEMRHGFLFRNGKRVEDSWASGLSEDVDVQVPEGKVFVMGDNSESSLDSRSFGCINLSSIKRVVIGK